MGLHIVSFLIFMLTGMQHEDSLMLVAEQDKQFFQLGNKIALNIKIMCLEVESERKVAKKDIVCYKRLIYRNLEPTGIKNGDEFTGEIKRIKCKGKIYIGEVFHKSMIYLCTNNPRLDGFHEKKFSEYPYSWLLDNDVHSIIVDGKELVIESLMTPYRRFLVEIGKEYVSDLILSKGFYSMVHVGLHSFKFKKDVKFDGRGVYAKCIIPKKSEYYEGTFDGAPSYASNRLKYLEIIN